MTKDLDKQFKNAKLWREEALALRDVLIGCGLDEEMKWGKPCYVHEGANICIIQRMKDFLALMFFKGALIDDPDGVLEPQGPNSRSAFRVTLTSVKDVSRKKKSVKALVRGAIAAEKSGAKVEKAAKLEFPQELIDAFRDDAEFKKAFNALTPGRQRGYVLHFAAAKQSKTRAARIAKYRDKILDGEGLHDR